MGLADILNDSTLKHYVTAERLPVSKLEVKDAFNQLSNKEKMYAHYFSQACLAGAPIVLHQVSTESPLIFELIVSMFQNGVDPLRKQNVVSDKDFDNLLIYVSQFLGNMGNYLSFGDSKFIPRLEKENFEKVVKASGSDKALSLWEKVKDAIYELKTGKLELDFGNNAYYNDSVTKEDAEKVQKYMDENNLIPNHTRLFKVGQNQFELRIASVEAREEAEFEYEGVKIKKIYGDFAEYNRRIRDNLQQALKYAANDKQASMIEKYIEYYNSGDIEAHVDSQRFWIQDKSPAVETNIGHIETYRDPLRVRGEFEGFVAVVNKEMSKKYGVLVDHAEELLKVLPWNKECPEQPFEIEKFSRPDFTSLEVLTFTTSGIPAGINIPNYPQVREVDGFKNVSLGNVLNATAPSEEITFLKENDQVLFRDLKGAAFGLQVAAHELLGHGSGRQITADKDGKLPFDLSKLISPVDKKPVSTFYKHGESFNSKFGEISNSYEECRAEAVGIYLTTFYEFLKIFGYEKDSQSTDDVVYVNWLLMVRAGLLGLEFYNPTSQKWLQAHMRARYCILQVLLEAGEGLVTIEENGDQVFITLDRSKIRTVGVQAIYNFLLKLGVYKSVCDVAAGSAMYEKYTSVNERFLNLRRIVMDKKQPRKVFVQPLTTIVNNNVELVEFEPSHEGMIKCFTQLVKL